MVIKSNEIPFVCSEWTYCNIPYFQFSWKTLKNARQTRARLISIQNNNSSESEGTFLEKYMVYKLCCYRYPKNVCVILFLLEKYKLIKNLVEENRVKVFHQSYMIS